MGLDIEGALTAVIYGGEESGELNTSWLAAMASVVLGSLLIYLLLVFCGESSLFSGSKSRMCSVLLRRRGRIDEDLVSIEIISRLFLC